MNVKRLLFSLCLFVLFFHIKGNVHASGRYQIRINKQQNCVTIYELNANGKYKPIKAFVCSTGSATPLGTFGLKEKIRWHELDGPVYGQYCTRITGHVLFHSVWYYVNGNPATLSNYQYNRLGQTASHGCVRLTVADAKWIYDNVPFGTGVTIYNSSDPGPLGKPKAIQLPDGRGWDPTDVTNPNNPYNKKKPTLKVKGGNVTYASKFDVLKDVEARNTTGFDSKDLIEYTIGYRAKGQKGYKNVKTVNTLKPGLYRVRYNLTDEINRTAKRTVTYKVLNKVPIRRIQLNKSSRTLYIGGDGSRKTYKLKVSKITPRNASIQDINFVSSNTRIVTVKGNGLVTAKRTGSAEVTAHSKDGSGKTAVCRFSVKRYADSVALTAAATTIGVGQTTGLTATVTPKSTTNKRLSFASSDSTIASVEANGLVIGYKPGTVTITVTTTDGSGIKATIKITVIRVYASMATNQMGEVGLPEGTSLEEAVSSLPAVVAITDTNGDVGSASINWTIPSYNPTIPYRYTAEGTLTLPEGWTGNPEKIYATVTIGNPDPSSNQAP